MVDCHCESPHRSQARENRRFGNCKQLNSAHNGRTSQESIELLKSLGFIKPISEERVKLSDPHITIQGAEKAEAIRNFQSKVMQFGIRSLKEIQPDERDISTITMAVDSQGFQDIKDMIREFRKELQIRVDKCGVPDRVMQLNLALFPVAHNKKGKTK